MTESEALLADFTREHIGALNALVREAEGLDGPTLDVPRWEDGPADFDGSKAPDTLEDAIKLGLEWQAYATKLHDLLEAHAETQAHLPALAAKAREALIRFGDLT